ncbi:MAG: dihydroorotate dehydrogenase [Candidatus Aenigmarchaeota archaeon]|nr:dihydroorotate dehydrogenase [Candidatus Aenigmarchaeota archaeon]
MSVKLNVELAGLKLKNPIILASGILGISKKMLLSVAKAGAGAVTTKSITIKPREGHKNPILIQTTEETFLNAVGYSNPGLEESKKEFKDLSNFPVPVIGSLVGSDAEEFAYLAENVKGIDFKAIEIVLSCPHTPGFGLLAEQGTPEATEEITLAVRRKTKLPLFVKVSPNIMCLGDVVKAAEKAGADGITAINTVGPGMAIDVETAKPILDFKFGGMSGPAIRPIAIRCVYDIYESVKIPIIGLGGIITGKDAIEMIMAGATAVGIGTGIYYRELDIFKKVCDEINEFMKSHGYSKLKDIVGIAHRD